MSSVQYVNYQDLLLPPIAHTKESLEFAENFSVEDTDVFAVTYPKSGDIVSGPHGHQYKSITTRAYISLILTSYISMKQGTIWMQEILPLILNDGDLTQIQTIPNWDRTPWLEENRLALVVDQLKSPRALVTHFPYHLMPASFHQSKAKAIYVMRDPKDVFVSFYYFHQMAAFLEDPGTFDEFLDKFLNGNLVFGKWTDHIKSWKNNNLGDRIMFITYEEMKKDLPSALRRISSFLGKNLSDETIHKIADRCTFKAMKDNPMSNFSLVPKIYMDSDKSPFLRKGVAGDWKNHFTPEQLSRFTSTINKELEGESFSLPWSLD